MGVRGLRCRRHFFIPIQPITTNLRKMYGIFYERNRHFEGTGYRAGRWPWRVGRYQPAGRLRQRQPWRECSCTVKKQATENKR